MKALVSLPHWNAVLALALLIGFGAQTSAAEDTKKADPVLPASKELARPAALDKPVPAGVEDLKAIQTHIKKTLDKVIPATVALRIGPAWGSGVIVSEDGYVLTAAHVSGKADRECVIIMPDGKEVKGKTLGGNTQVDGGMVKITEKGKWPYVEMGRSSKVKAGDWCVVIGHPGGFRPGRAPVVRVGRVSASSASLIRTDATLVGGDSGGPLFDADGKVIGINSRIGMRIVDNIHVPVDTYRDGWDRLVKGEVWGGSLLGFGDPKRDAPKTVGAWLGVQRDADADNCRITGTVEDSPAEKAGFLADDVITRFDGKPIASFPDLAELVGAKKPGDEVVVVVRRGSETVRLKVVLGARPE
jgi:serine protease Do